MSCPYDIHHSHTIILLMALQVENYQNDKHEPLPPQPGLRFALLISRGLRPCLPSDVPAGLKITRATPRQYLHRNHPRRNRVAQLPAHSRKLRRQNQRAPKKTLSTFFSPAALSFATEQFFSFFLTSFSGGNIIRVLYLCYITCFCLTRPLRIE